MRAFLSVLATALSLLWLASCTNAKTPPMGRWEGAYEAEDAMVVVRLEISNKGDIYLSAPNALDIAAATAEQRPGMREHLAEELASGWTSVEPRRLDFDGRVFRKPGGIAPQLEWNPDSRQMTVVLYLGMRTLRVPLRSVAQFSANPWAA